MIGHSGQATAPLPNYNASNENINPESEHGYQALSHPISVQQDMVIPDNGCQCGSMCNCVYCTKHPRNAATRDRIGELYDIMDDQLTEDYFDPSQLTIQENLSQIPHPFEPQFGFSHGFYMQSDEHLGFDHPRMNTQNFVEMAYPVGGCANGRCRCGENCACDGCLTHTGHLQTPLN